MSDSPRGSSKKDDSAGKAPARSSRRSAPTGPRVIEDVPPFYLVSDELEGDAAIAKLDDEIQRFLDHAERYVSAREEFECRISAELNAWGREERRRLGLDELLGRDLGKDGFDLNRLTIPGVPEGLEEAIDERVRPTICTEFGINDLGKGPRLQITGMASRYGVQSLIDVLSGSFFWRTRHVHIFVKSTNDADSLVNHFPSSGPRIQAIRGRSNRAHLDPMCKKWKAAEYTSAAGLNVHWTLCDRWDRGSKRRVCEHYKTCPYIAQWKDRQQGIRVFNHHYLYLPTPRPEGVGLPTPDLVIVIDNVIEAFASHTDFGVDRLDGAAFDAVQNNLSKGTDLREAMVARRITSIDARRIAIDFESGVETDVTPDMPESRAISSLFRMAKLERKKQARFWRRVEAEIDLERPFHGIEVVKDHKLTVNGDTEYQDRVLVHWLQRLKFGPATPILLIDPDLDPCINRMIFKEQLQSVEIRAKRHARIIQCDSSRFSNHKLLYEEPKK